MDYTLINKDLVGNALITQNPEAGMFSGLFKITDDDLKELQKVSKQRIKIIKPFGIFKVGDILDVKIIRNISTSEPPNFLVIDEKLGSSKFSMGGRNYTPFYEEYKGEINSSTDASGETFLQKHKNHLLIAGALLVGYFVYKKFNK